MKRIYKIAVSPLIATILIVVISVAIIGIIFSWGKAFSLNEMDSVKTIKNNPSYSAYIKTENLSGSRYLLSNTFEKQINLVSYKILSIDNNYDFLDEYITLDTPIILDKANSQLIDLKCIPNKDFKVVFNTDTNEYFTMNFKHHNPNIQLCDSNPQLFSTSSSFSIFLSLENNSIIKSWGRNNYGQLGNQLTENNFYPITVLDQLDITNISSAINHSCVLLSDNTIKCFGNNAFGELGDGTHISDKDLENCLDGENIYYCLNPRSVMDISNAIDIELSYYHSCAILSDKTAKCWGQARFGQLGDGSDLSSPDPSCELYDLGKGSYEYFCPTPKQVLNLSNVSKLSLGSNHSCALLEDGKVKCWGDNSNGELGDGSYNNSTTPVYIIDGLGPAPLENIIDLSVGSNFGCVLLEDTTVRCWGANTQGQLGLGYTNSEIITPAPVVLELQGGDPLTGVIKIVAGAYSACALLDDFTVKCWGQNALGQLGLGYSSNYVLIPTLVSAPEGGTLSNVSKIALGSSHSCFILEDNTTLCSGSNEYGELGNCSVEPISTLPVEIDLSLTSCD